MPNPVVHFEVTSADGKALQKFYTDAFGWSVDANNPMQYGMVEAQGEGIGGGIGTEEEGIVTFYIQVDDPAAYLKKVQSLGGKVVQEPQDVPGGPTIARFADPAGNVIGLVKAQ